MRRRVVVVTLVVVLVAGVAILARRSAAKTEAPRDFPHYSFIITKTDNGFKLTCRENCAWKELKYSCRLEGCGAVVDEHGVRTALEEDWPK